MIGKVTVLQGFALEHLMAGERDLVSGKIAGDGELPQVDDRRGIGEARRLRDLGHRVVHAIAHGREHEPFVASELSCGHDDQPFRSLASRGHDGRFQFGQIARIEGILYHGWLLGVG